MMDSTYAGAYGYMKVLYTELLKKEELMSLESAETKDFISRLGTTIYKEDLDRFYSMYKEPDIIDIAVNAHFVRMCTKAMVLLPPIGREVIRAYLRKIDIQNIKLVLSAKSLGKEVEVKDYFLTVDSGFPVGSSSPLLSNEDYVNLINQKSVQDIISYLTRFGYSSSLLKFSVSSESSHNTRSISLALDIDYYDRLKRSLKFYNGDEGPVLRFIQSLIDLRNIMTVIKAIELGVSPADLLIDGGNISKDQLLEESKRNLEGFINKLPFDLKDALALYNKDGLIANFEIELKRQIYSRYLSVFRGSSLSLGNLLGFVISAEIEKDSVRLGWFKKYYKLEKEVIDIGYGI
ncbi:MAG: V-type ATPase subunit [Candidatus Parvarchaeota archaeon]|nr:V-type ATPase subunit [Candidatus Parvarchaeota archaeon]